MNISLPESMRTYVEEQVASGGYGSASEYFRELVRLDKKRKATERVEAERKAEAAGMSLSDFGREAYLNAVVTTRRGSTDEVVIVALNRIGVDFSRMCSNLNQITKNNNSGRQLSPEFPFVMQEAASMMAEIKELIAKVDHGS